MPSNDDWKEITVETSSEIWDKKETLEGKLVGKKSGVGPNESWLYTIKVKDGEVGVWGSTVLDTKFEGIESGSMVRIEPQGKVKSEKTGREYQDFKVFVKPPQFDEVQPVGDEPISLGDIPF